MKNDKCTKLESSFRHFLASINFSNQFCLHFKAFYSKYIIFEYKYHQKYTKCYVRFAIKKISIINFINIINLLTLIRPKPNKSRKSPKVDF
jgi:hypothetical protein